MTAVPRTSAWVGFIAGFLVGVSAGATMVVWMWGR